MSVERLSPDGVASPTGLYSHISISPPGARLVWFAGQVGRVAGGFIPDGAEAQATVAFDNLESLFSHSGLAFSDIVQFRTFLVGRSAIAGFARARNDRFKEWFGTSAPPPNTLVIVQGLADPRALVEIEVVGVLPAAP